MSRNFIITLRIVCDDPEEDPRMWPYDELLASPQGEPDRFIGYVFGVEEAVDAA